ncbi:hypothetical protein N7532_006482 [Penicillium argentinense]|uniref:Uncharacterized protein n=1 Tax=Penicillium argentinense TaxID=1131581 RepID=A0A9W9KBC5_9EURO|nr:uncharacterized protein N7532_006482 [Penicillium argentinense]KAJ5099481.1 hypothetical protein N7532_006482 [Penicillium argentinense]
MENQSGSGSGSAVMKLLLEQNKVANQITKRIVDAAMKSRGNAKAVMGLLLEEKRVNFQFIDEALKEYTRENQYPKRISPRMTNGGMKSKSPNSFFMLLR